MTVALASLTALQTSGRCREQQLREAKRRQRGSASASLGRDGYRLIGWPRLVAFAKGAV